MMPSKKRKYNARFPAGRIKKIMQTDEDVGKVAQAVPIIISRALELFVESLLKKTVVITNAKNAKTLTPQHMKQCIQSESRFDFLKELVSNISDVSTGEDEPTTPLTSGPSTPFPTTLKKAEGAPSRGRGRGGSRQSSHRKTSSSLLTVVPSVQIVSSEDQESLVKKENAIRLPVIQHTGSSSTRPLPDDSGEEEDDDDEEEDEEERNGYVEISNHSKPLVIDEDYDT